MTDVRVPDIGQDEPVEVIEVCVKVGDTIAAEDSVIVLESDKASMDIPSPAAGTVTEVLVSVGDKVGKDTVILRLDGASAKQEPTEQAAPATSSASSTQTWSLPDLGTDEAVEVIAIEIKPGDSITQDQEVITLESDKASMDVPAQADAVVSKILISVGDKVTSGTPYLEVTLSGPSAEPTKKPATAPAKEPAKTAPSAPRSASSEIIATNNNVHAGPATRRLARELGVDLSKVSGTGRKGRILTPDVHKYVKGILTSGASAGGGLGVAPMPQVDFAKFGEIEEVKLSKIKKLTAKNLHRNWVLIPHVTHNDSADITEMDAFRKNLKDDAAAKGVRLTPLAFIMKAAVGALKEFPQFNSSLSADGEVLIQKNYYHIGVAVDTPNGLVVPVIRNVNDKGIYELADELAKISAKARDVGLSKADMEGGTFTISSLGGIGGSSFTPIINAPEVAILGVSKASMQPVFDGKGFIPRLMLPVSLSYDHRVCDGAEAARFCRALCDKLSDIRKIIL